MNDKENRPPIPGPVQRKLRREVNYGCPFPGCGKPFLHFHHFNPQYHILHHFNPAGMIAVCSEHHSPALNIDPEILNKYKQNPNSSKFIESKFPWIATDCIIRLGGCYAFNNCSIFLEDEPIFWTQKANNHYEQLLFNFIIKNKNDDILLGMRNNNFIQFPQNIPDLKVTPSANRIKMWFDYTKNKEKIGFECTFRRMKLDKFEEMLIKDEKTISNFEKEIKNFPLNSDNHNDLLEKININSEIANYESYYNSLRKVKSISELHTKIVNSNPVIELIRWYASKTLKSDNKIQVLNFVKCVFWNKGKKIEMKNGKIENLRMCFFESLRFKDGRVSMS